jgi:hypothetical protein
VRPGDIAGFRSAVALHGLVRALKAGGTDPIDGVSEKIWRERIASRLAAELEAKPSYACSGSSASTTGAASWSRRSKWPERRGQDRPGRGLAEAKRSRYFQETIRLGPGQIYVSPLDLGRCNGLIEEVHRPTIRVATPIFAATASRSAFSWSMSTCGARSTASGHRRGRRDDLRRQPVRRLSHSSRSFARIRRAARQAQRLESRLPASGGAGRGNARQRRHRAGSGRRPAG